MAEYEYEKRFLENILHREKECAQLQNAVIRGSMRLTAGLSKAAGRYVMILN